MQPAANALHFTLVLNGHEDFAVYSFDGREAVSEPYVFAVELVHRNARLELAPFIGTPALLTILDKSSVPRLIHGIVREMRRLQRGNTFTHYRCVIVPRVWFLDQNRNHRIFQNANVPDIITQILEEQGFASETFAFKCFTRYQPREYCVQYGESDLYFISRLCEEEGIYYYFEHTENGHCLCFSDMPGGPDIPGGPNLLYRFGAGLKADTAVISDLHYHVAARGNAVTFREWNFEKYWADLTVGADEPDRAKVPVPPGMIMEDYRYPHLYGLCEPGRRYANIDRGLQKHTFYFHVKECEFRFNHRREDLYKLILSLLRTTQYLSLNEDVTFMTTGINNNNPLDTGPGLHYWGCNCAGMDEKELLEPSEAYSAQEELGRQRVLFRRAVDAITLVTPVGRGFKALKGLGSLGKKLLPAGI